MSSVALPSLNACLNATSAILLVIGYLLIRKKRRDAHRATMLSAVAVSIAFLCSYLIYHWQAGATRYTAQGPIRTLYFTILISHTLLAASVPPLLLATLLPAWRGDFALHRRRARWTLPIWLYVSATGVVVYLMLYGRPS